MEPTRHLVFLAFAVMRWLIIALLGSLVALLIAAAGMARHIWLQRRGHDGAAPPEAPVLPGKTDFESEP